MAQSDASKVVCTGEGLRFGYINRPIKATISTRSAGAGELTVFCNGPKSRAYCELDDQGQGTFNLTVSPQEAGTHRVHIQFDGKEVKGSPFMLRVSPASLVDVQGPGIHNGLIHNYKAEFRIDTKMAVEKTGAAEIHILMGGPQGAFRMMTKKEGKHKLLCRYDPKVPGMYTLNISWDDDPLPGSPFHVYICQNKQELLQHNREKQSHV